MLNPKIKHLMTVFAVAVAISAFPLTLVAQNRAEYTPPPRKGMIYIVVKFKPYSSSDQMRMDEKTRISVRWGNYSRSAAYGRGRLSVSIKEGFVISLRHEKDDSVKMFVESEGQILRIEQLNAPPPQWNSSNYDKYSW